MFEILNVRNIDDLENRQQFNEEGVITNTSKEQCDVENVILKKYKDLAMNLKVKKHLPELLRKAHVKYLREQLIYLPTFYEALDSSRPWLCYWITHALTILDETLNNSIKSNIAHFLGKCQAEGGGFGGGPGQIPHIAATYAAVNALVILGTEEAYQIINRKKLYEFLMRMRDTDGSFHMHDDGEIDIRGAYCALSVASLTNIMTPELCENTFEWIISCQSYEGGFSGVPGMEAHGGYAFCGLAALIILKKGHMCDLQALLRWLVNRQMKLEGGFSGRTNKLVDGCYSFWQGGAFPLIYSLLANEGHPPNAHLFDERALQEYILTCCQNPHGGLLDKPGRPRDVYHSAYTLSGLTVAQHFNQGGGANAVLGTAENVVRSTNPLYNIRTEYVRKAILYFSSPDLPNCVP